MLKLHTDEERPLQFEINIQGIDHKQLQGRLKFVIEKVEYGFPVEILSDCISVKIPPLDDIVKVGLKEGTEVECKLDVYGNGFYLNPWSGKFKLRTPVRMEAKMMADVTEDTIISETKSKEKSFTAKLKGEDNDDIKTESELDEGADDLEGKEDGIPEKHEPEEYNDLNRDEVIEMLENILRRKNKKTTSVGRIKRESKTVSTKKSAPPIRTKKKLVEVVSKTGRKYKVSKKIADKIAEMQSLVDGKLTGVKKKHVSEEKVRPKLKSKDPVRLMESLGMKNKTIQNVMLEKSKTMSGDDKDSQYAALERLLGVGNTNVISEMEQVHNSLRHGNSK